MVVGGAFVVLQLSTLGVTPLLGLPHGVYVTLFVCVLPSFFAGFLSAAWLMRVLAGALAVQVAAAAIAPPRLRVADPGG